MRTTLFAASLSILTAAAAMASPDRQVYVGAFTGLHAADTQEMRGANAAGAQRNIDIEYDDAALFGVNLGVAGPDYGWGRLRAEIEVAHRENDVDQLILNGVERGVRDGSHTSVTTAMVNAYWDSRLLQDRFRVGAGAGFGLAGIDHEVRYRVERPASAGGDLAIAIPNTETTFAYQLIGQGEWELGANLSLVGDVRYFDAGAFQAERYVLTTGAFDSVLDTDWTATEATIGLRYRF